ncbi:MAG: hypothetical protein ACYS47_16705, partial [Planctomycetota bacterium]
MGAESSTEDAGPPPSAPPNDGLSDVPGRGVRLFLLLAASLILFGATPLLAVEGHWFGDPEAALEAAAK